MKREKTCTILTSLFQVDAAGGSSLGSEFLAKTVGRRHDFAKNCKHWKSICKLIFKGKWQSIQNQKSKKEKQPKISDRNYWIFFTVKASKQALAQ